MRAAPDRLDVNQELPVTREDHEWQYFCQPIDLGKKRLFDAWDTDDTAN